MMKFIVFLLFEIVVLFCLCYEFPVVYADQLNTITNEQTENGLSNGPYYPSADLDTEKEIEKSRNETTEKQKSFGESRRKRQASGNKKKNKDEEIKITVNMKNYNVPEEKILKKELERLLQNQRLDKYEKVVFLNLHINLKKKLTQHQKNKLRTSISNIVKGRLPEYLKMYLMKMNEKKYGKLLEQKIKISKHDQDRFPIVDMNYNDLQVAQGVLRNIILAEVKKLKEGIMKKGQRVSFAINFLPPKKSTRKSFVLNLKWINDILRKKIPSHKTIRILTDSQMKKDIIKNQVAIVYIIPSTGKMTDEEKLIKKIVTQEVIKRLEKINKKMSLKFDMVTHKDEIIAGEKQEILTAFMEVSRNLPSISDKKIENIFKEISKSYPKMKLKSFVAQKDSRSSYLIFTLQLTGSDTKGNNSNKKPSNSKQPEKQKTQPNDKEKTKPKEDKLDDEKETRLEETLPEDLNANYETDSEETTENFTNEYTEQLDIVSTEDQSDLDSKTTEENSEVFTEKFEFITSTTTTYPELYESETEMTIPEVFEELTTTENYSENNETEVTTVFVNPNNYENQLKETSTGDFNENNEFEVTTVRSYPEDYEDITGVTTIEDYNKNNESEVTKFGVNPEEYKDGLEVTTTEDYTKSYGLEVNLDEYENETEVSTTEETTTENYPMTVTTTEVYYHEYTEEFEITTSSSSEQYGELLFQSEDFLNNNEGQTEEVNTYEYNKLFNVTTTEDYSEKNETQTEKIDLKSND